MSGFWITGIAINIVALALVLVWARKAWKQSDADGRRHRGDD